MNCDFSKDAIHDRIDITAQNPKAEIWTTLLIFTTHYNTEFTFNHFALLDCVCSDAHYELNFWLHDNLRLPIFLELSFFKFLDAISGSAKVL